MITGANRGLGFALVKHYLKHDFRVLATCRSVSNAKALMALQEDNSYSNRLSYYALDVTDLNQIRRTVDELKGIEIDVLINNAGVFEPVAEDDPDYFSAVHWEAVFNVNVIAVMRLSTQLMPCLLLGENKLVVNVSSEMGSITRNTAGGYYLYRASKAAQNAITKNLALDLREHNITCIALHPGWVRTDMGGAEAPLLPEESSAKIFGFLESVTIEQTGQFFTCDGVELDW